MNRFPAALALFAATLLLVQFAAAQPDPLAAFKFADTNKDKKLSPEEFRGLVERSPRLKGRNARELFDRLDTNKDGFLSLEEFRKLAEPGPGQPGVAKKATPAASGVGFNDTPTAEQVAFFEKKIRPVLIDHCYKCHSADGDKVKGGLLLDTRGATRKGGDTGPSVVPGNPDRSLLIRALRYKDESMRMPPKAKLPDDVIADIEAWVRMGAPDPRDGAKAAHKEIDIEAGRQFWAFQTPKKVTPPVVKNAAWPKADSDRFLLAALEAKGIKPVGDADKRTLLRRVYFDLTGLPPTPAEVEAFVADTSPTAFEKVVDKLLASPRFGERWGRHWLDVARYAETSGKTANFNYPHAWRYRDYVIAALNADKPYDQFVKEQLAGDLMASSDPKVRAERLVATGFLAIGPKALNERNGMQFELDVADEQIDVTTQAFLGITAACARCHDHKYDPIPQTDYYALAGIFRSTETCYGTVRFVQSQRPSPLVQLTAGSAPSALADKLTATERATIEKAIADIQQKMRDTKEPINNIFNAAQLAQNRSRLDSYDADGTPKLQAMGARDKPARGGFGGPKKAGPGFGGGGGPKGGFGGSPTVADSPLFVRGEVDKPGAVVPRGVLQVVTKNTPAVRAGSGRKELADWIASKDNPLTARVMVNRVWLHLFGRGLVPTPDNFGAAGQAPSHPELLDHLAVGFTDDGWSVKRLIRRVVLSRAYQLDSRADPANLTADPDNALVWRMTPRRLDAEALRDSILAVSGQIDLAPPVGSVVAQAGEGPSGRQRLGDSITRAVNDPRNAQRSVFLPVVRDNLPEALSLFDAADPSLVVAERPVTTVPSQSLYLLNNPFVLRASDAAAEKVFKAATTEAGRVTAAYKLFFGRVPNEKEQAVAAEFLEAYRSAATRDRVPEGRRDREVWAAFCQAFFASAEFQYRK